MGFLWKTVFAGRFSKTNLFVLAVIASIFACGLFSSAIYAEEVVEKVEEKVEKAVEVAAEEAKEVPAKKTARKPRAKKAPAKKA